MMRINVYQKIQMSFFNLFILLLIVNSLSIPIISAQEESALIIQIYDSNDWNKTTGNILFEGRKYDIIISSQNETVILGVNISLLGSIYTTSLSVPYITFLAPNFENSKSFMISAIKETYLPAEIEITVMKGQLIIVADRVFIEEKKGFQIAVNDQNNEPVEGALVYVNTEDTQIITDEQGIAYIQAPDVERSGTAIIQVNKSGYLTGSINIYIENLEGLTFILSDSQFFQILPILIAVIVVIISIIYVMWRQKRTTIRPYQTKPMQPTDTPNTFQQKKQFTNQPLIFHKKDKEKISITVFPSKVEEIRVPIQGKQKETTFLSREQLKQELKEKKKEELDWFKGQDYMRYKIDELTGKIDKETNGKWFEGEKDSKNKVDETLQQSFKKKKNNKENPKY